MPSMDGRVTDPTLGTFDKYDSLAMNQSRFDDFSENLAYVINVYYTPLLVFFGTIGNILSILVFCRSKLRRQSTGSYLSMLAVSDTVFLILLVPPWLKTIQLTELFSRPIFCQISVYGSYVTCCTSAWLVIAFTVERLLAVLYPLRRNAMCTMARARNIICLLMVSSLALNLPMLPMTDPTEDDCKINLKYIKQAARFNIVDTAMSFSVPLGLIIVLNVWIMIGVKKLERARRQLMKGEGPGAYFVARVRYPCGPGCQQSQLRVTRMLLIVSSVYVLLNLPAYTMRIIAYAYDMSEDQYTRRWAAWQQISLCMFNTNFGINFILYCLTGQNFRHALLKTIPILRGARRSEGVDRADRIRVPRASNDSTSLVNVCTEPTCIFGQYAPAVAAMPAVTGHDGNVIKRWKFDNSRQRLRVRPPQREDIEMQVFSSGNSQAAGPSGMQQSTRQVPQTPYVRKIPYNLFPYKNLIIDRRVQYKTDVAEAMFN